MATLKRPRDAMRMRSYQWEQDIVSPRDNGELLSEEAVIAECNILTDAWRLAMGLRFGQGFRPAVTFKSTRLGACAWTAERVEFGPLARRRWIVAHEVAHTIAYLIAGRNEAGHGQTWRDVHAETLAVMGIVPRRTIERSMGFYRIGDGNWPSRLFVKGASPIIFHSTYRNRQEMLIPSPDINVARAA